MPQTGGLKIKGIVKKSTPDKPLVSIVTAVFNGARYLEETIQSVLGQTYDNIEYIIIDGGSTDGSLDIIKKYDKRIDYWLSNNDAGMYDAINVGLKIAGGSIFAYLNSDDLYYQQTVRIAVDCFQKYPYAEVLFGSCNFIGPRGELIYKYRFPKYRWLAYVCFTSSSLAQPAAFWRSSIHKKIGYFDITFKCAGDFDFFAMAGKCCRFLRVKETLAAFRMHNAAMTATLQKRIKEENDLVHKRYINIGKVSQFFLRSWLHLQIKYLNLPVMIKKAFGYFTKLKNDV